MNIKSKLFSAGILIALSTAAGAQTPPSAPDVYAQGPAAPLVSTVNLSEPERAAYALLEAVLQVTEDTIHSTGCNPGYYNLEVYANGAVNSGMYNFAAITDENGSPQYTLSANVQTAFPGRGQLVTVAGWGGWFGSTQLVSYQATFAYNSANSMMVTTSSTTNLYGIDGTVDVYTGNIIKDFFLGSDTPGTAGYYNIFDWGLISVSKLGYPVEKWWQRSESHRSDGVSARTVFVKDRLVGETACRIIIDVQGDNDSGLYWEGANSASGLPGALTITNDIPSNPVTYTVSNPILGSYISTLIGPSGSVWDGCAFNEGQCMD